MKWGFIFNKSHSSFLPEVTNCSWSKKFPSKTLFGFISGATTTQASNWPDARLGPFAPKDPNFPLPGSVGIDLAQLAQPDTEDGGLHIRTVADALLDLESEDVRKAVVLDTYMKDVAEENYEDMSQTQVWITFKCINQCIFSSPFECQKKKLCDVICDSCHWFCCQLVGTLSILNCPAGMENHCYHSAFSCFKILWDQATQMHAISYFSGIC